jgi:hypothetical protein
MMDKHISIDEIENGFTVTLYADYPSDKKYDKTVFCQRWKDVTKLIANWKRDVDNQGQTL